MRSILKYILFFCLVACSSSTEIPNSFIAKVVGVKDGDTIEVLYDGKDYVIRLLDIDCPEKKQPFGTKAKQFTSNLCFGKEVKIVSHGKRDRYHRILATIYIDNLNLNEELLKVGLAWHYKQYSIKQEYALIESAARHQRIGVWTDDCPIAPWDFRKRR